MSAPSRPSAVPGARDVGQRPVDAVVSHLLDPYRSGVARFNEQLASRLGVGVLGLCTDEAVGAAAPLLSVKLSQLGDRERSALLRVLDAERAPGSIRVFLHEIAPSPLEERLINEAGWVFSGNEEIHARVSGLTERCSCLWSPATLQDVRPLTRTETLVFSFGMADRIQTSRFVRLHRLLEDTGRSYSLHISNAVHELAEMRDARLIAEEMHRIFGPRVFFMGQLSDVAVVDYLRRATYFAAFFALGARANNSTVVAAMEHGAVVVTNLDELSPAYLRHMDTVIDIGQCRELPTDPRVLRAISVRATEAARSLGWEPFLAAIRPHATSPSGGGGPA
jgi:hypothetical protein